jgi:hypothetical protein
MSPKNLLVGTLFTTLIIVSFARGGESPKEPPAGAFFNDLSSPLRGVDADSSLWMIYDNGMPQYVFPLPDVFNDHYFNVRFTPPDSCKLIRAAFGFFKNHPDNDSTGIPDIHVLVWENDTANPLYPVHPDSAAPLDSVLIDSASLEPYINRPDSAYPYPIPYSAVLPLDTLFVDLDTLELYFHASESFHIGWEPVPSSPVDSLALLADDGYPSTTTSIEWWDSTFTHPDPEWRTIESDWGLGVDFFISVEVEVFIDTTTTYVWLEPDRIPNTYDLAGPYPNPFNPETTLLISLDKSDLITLQAYDLSGRLVDEIASGSFPAGQSAVSWQPHNLPSGVYLVRMESSDRSVLVKAVLLK